MIRRRLLHYIAALPLVSLSAGVHGAPSRAGRAPGHLAWPSQLDWEALRQQARGNLSALRSPLEACSGALDAQACPALFRSPKAPDSPVLTRTCGWVGAWTAQPRAIWCCQLRALLGHSSSPKGRSKADISQNFGANRAGPSSGDTAMRANPRIGGSDH
jgi:hypothetical protein